MTTVVGIVWLLWWLFPTTTNASSAWSAGDCIPCHMVRIDDSIEVVDPTQQLPKNQIKCITQHPRRSYRAMYDIENLPASFVPTHQHVIDGGDAFVCLKEAYIDESSNCIVMTSKNDDDDTNSRNDDTLTVTSYKASQQQQYRSFQPNQPEIRLLVVRIIDVNGIEPVESMEQIEGAIFGTGSNPDNISETASVVQQLASITHHQVSLVPANMNSTQSSGGGVVIDVPIALSVNGSGFFRELLSEILNATESVVGPMMEAADAYIFCVPDGATLVGQTGWTGFSTSNEPVRCLSTVNVFDQTVVCVCA